MLKSSTRNTFAVWLTSVCTANSFLLYKKKKNKNSISKYRSVKVRPSGRHSKSAAICASESNLTLLVLRQSRTQVSSTLQAPTALWNMMSVWRAQGGFVRSAYKVRGGGPRQEKRVIFRKYMFKVRSFEFRNCNVACYLLQTNNYAVLYSKYHWRRNTISEGLAKFILILVL
jgi:hypothetical protein